MKRLFLLLFFINIVYFFWGMSGTGESIEVVQQAPLYKHKTLEKLVLLTEKEELALAERPQVEQKEVASEVLEQKAEAANECYVVGDSRTQSAAAPLLISLSEFSQQAAIVAFNSLNEYWVTYPSNGDWQQSLQNVEELKSKNITDLWLVPNGDYQGVVSLGVFVTQEHADKRLKELAAKQVNAVVLSRKKNRYGVKVETNRGEGSIKDFLNASQPAGNNSIRKFAC